MLAIFAIHCATSCFIFWPYLTSEKKLMRNTIKMILSRFILLVTGISFSTFVTAQVTVDSTKEGSHFKLS